MIELNEPPHGLAARPVDPRRKLPIPWVNEHVNDDGSVRVTFIGVNGQRSLECATERLCGICGQPLDYWIAFLGGPRTAQQRSYGDPPMHEACAQAAVALCPHIALRRHERAPEHRVDADLSVPNGWVENKPNRWVMGITRAFETRIDDGYPIFTAAPFKQVRVFGYDDHGRITEITAIARVRGLDYAPASSAGDGR